MKLFLYRGLYIIQELYTGINLILQILAVLLTYIIVVSGFDWNYFLSVRNQTLNAFFFPALLVGFLVPVIFPLVLLAFGYFRNHKETKEEGVLLSYAAFFGWFISSLYKAFTGRVQPDLFNTSVDTSKNFNFGFFEHGIFWG